MENARERLGDAIEYNESPYEAAEGAEGLVLVTDWPQFKEMNLDRLRECMTLPVVVDGRNLLDPSTMREKGFIYHSVGRP